MQAIGHAVVGDDRYRGVRPALRAPRPNLHAAHQRFVHPWPDERMRGPDGTVSAASFPEGTGAPLGGDRAHPGGAARLRPVERGARVPGQGDAAHVGLQPGKTPPVPYALHVAIA